MAKHYKHLYFDLDLTLWDFDANSASALQQIIEEFSLQEKVTNPKKFIGLFKVYNEQVWELYRLKKMNKKELRYERFRLLFNDFGITDKNLICMVQEYYTETAPTKQVLIEGTREVLEYLFPKYSLYIVSNGFMETQKAKMENSDIARYFKRIFTSDQVGFAKPDKRIFEHCVKSVNAMKKESLFIGDDPINDVEGPKKFGMDQVFYNPSERIIGNTPTYEIKKLTELIELL